MVGVKYYAVKQHITQMTVDRILLGNRCHNIIQQYFSTFKINAIVSSSGMAQLHSPKLHNESAIRHFQCIISSDSYKKGGNTDKKSILIIFYSKTDKTFTNEYIIVGDVHFNQMSSPMTRKFSFSINVFVLFMLINGFTMTCICSVYSA